MARPLRVEFAGAIYHVMARGNARQDIVATEDDRRRLRDGLAKTVYRYGWELMAFVLMTNHLHLFLRTPRANLSAGMQYFLSGYANWFSRHHHRPGHLFQGRFRSELVEDESYFWEVSRYIHLNPLRARKPLALHPRDWAWSSYRGYARRRDRVDWVAYELVLSAWRGQAGGQDAGAAYRRFVESGLLRAAENPFRSAVHGWILGSEEYVARIRRTLAGETGEPSVPQKRRLLALAPERVLERVADFYGMDRDTFSSRRGGFPRSVAAWLARRVTTCTLNELAEHFGLGHPGSVSNLLRDVEGERDRSPVFRRELKELEASVFAADGIEQNTKNET